MTTVRLGAPPTPTGESRASDGAHEAANASRASVGHQRRGSRNRVRSPSPLARRLFPDHRWGCACDEWNEGRPCVRSYSLERRGRSSVASRDSPHDSPYDRGPHRLPERHVWRLCHRGCSERYARDEGVFSCILGSCAVCRASNVASSQRGPLGSGLRAGCDDPHRVHH